MQHGCNRIYHILTASLRPRRPVSRATVRAILSSAGSRRGRRFNIGSARRLFRLATPLFGVLGHLLRCGPVLLRHRPLSPRKGMCLSVPFDHLKNAKRPLQQPRCGSLRFLRSKWNHWHHHSIVARTSTYRVRRLVAHCRGRHEPGRRVQITTTPHWASLPPNWPGTWAAPAYNSTASISDVLNSSRPLAPSWNFTPSR